MRTASLILALFLVAPASVAAQGALFDFSAPAQANGAISTLNATWILAALEDGGALQARLNTTTPSQEQNITQVVLGRGAAGSASSDGFFLPVSSFRPLEPFKAELAATAPGRSSLYVSGQHLALNT